MEDTLVISGASSSGFVVLGKLARLMYEGFDFGKINIYGGTSIGAVICLLLAIGYTPCEITYWLRMSTVWDKLMKLNIMSIIQMKGVFSLKLLSDELDKLILNKLPQLPTFRDLKKKLLVVAFNLTERKVVYFNTDDHPDMCVRTAVILSCAIPFLFEPQNYNNARYVDGGIVDNFPLKATAEKFNCGKITGIICHKLREPSQPTDSWDLNNLHDVFCAPIVDNMNEQIKNSDATIFEVTSKIPFYDLRLNPAKIDEMFFAGFSN